MSFYAVKETLMDFIVLRSFKKLSYQQMDSVS